MTLNRILFIVFITLAATVVLAEEATMVWEGKLKRNNPDDDFKVILKIQPPAAMKVDQKVGTIEIPELTCSGELFLSKKDGTSFSMVNRVKENVFAECLDEGKVMIQMKGTELLFLQVHKKEDVVIAGTLKPQKRK